MARALSCDHCVVTEQHPGFFGTAVAFRSGRSPLVRNRVVNRSLGAIDLADQYPAVWQHRARIKVGLMRKWLPSTCHNYLLRKVVGLLPDSQGACLRPRTNAFINCNQLSLF